MRDNRGMARPSKSDPNRPEWAKRIEAARVLTGLDGKALANAIGIHEERYRKYERGEREPNVQVWAKISDFTGVSLDVLIKGVKAEPQQLRKTA
jgi:ribosome-binding protein aMBF1 (putative translation factor)